MARGCVYTVVTGGYEPLHEQEAVRESRVPFLCFTDTPEIKSATWEIRRLDRVLPDDPVRSQRAAKILAHRLLPEFDESLYIDNTVALTVAPDALFEHLRTPPGLALPRHSFHATLQDEFDAVAAHKLDDPQRIERQLRYYQEHYPELLAAPACWTGMLLRRHHDPEIIAAMESWFGYVMRFSRRDQLSAALAFAESGLKPDFLAWDNHASAFHTWPNLAGRNVAMRHWAD